MEKEKTLVVYFSRKGYVRREAEQTAARLDADLCELKTHERTAGVLGFLWCGRFGMHRWGMPLEGYADVCAYDRVVICSPVWVFTVCAPVRQFVIENAGKIKRADYTLVHFSGPMKYRCTVARLDKTLGIKTPEYTSVCCMLGHVFARRIVKRSERDA